MQRRAHLKGPTILRNVPGTSLYFATLDRLRSAMLGTWHNALLVSLDGKRLTHCGNLLLGAVSRASVGFVLMPVTVLKVRFEVCSSGALSASLSECGFPVRVDWKSVPVHPRLGRHCRY